MRHSRFSGMIAVLGVCLLIGALAAQAIAQDGTQTRATPSRANRLQAKVMTDGQMDQVTAGGLSFGINLIKEGALDLSESRPNFEGLKDIAIGTIVIVKGQMSKP